MEEDLANLQFYSALDPGGAAVNWFDYEESAEATGWLDDELDVVEEFQPGQSLVGAQMSVIVERVRVQIHRRRKPVARNSLGIGAF